MNKKTVKHLNLLQIRLPLPGIVSILHRVSGAVLVLALPVALYFLQLSIGSKESYDIAAECLSHPLMKLVTLGCGWAFFHHLCAGVRFLLLDIHQGITLPVARASAAAVICGGVLLTFLLLLAIW